MNSHKGKLRGTNEERDKGKTNKGTWEQNKQKKEKTKNKQKNKNKEKRKNEQTIREKLDQRMGLKEFRVSIEKGAIKMQRSEHTEWSERTPKKEE